MLSKTARTCPYCLVHQQYHKCGVWILVRKYGKKAHRRWLQKLSLGHMSGVSALSVYSIKQSKLMPIVHTLGGGVGCRICAKFAHANSLALQNRPILNDKMIGLHQGHTFYVWPWFAPIRRGPPIIDEVHPRTIQIYRSATALGAVSHGTVEGRYVKLQNYYRTPV